MDSVFRTSMDPNSSGHDDTKRIRSFIYAVLLPISLIALMFFVPTKCKTKLNCYIMNYKLIFGIFKYIFMIKKKCYKITFNADLIFISPCFRFF